MQNMKENPCMKIVISFMAGLLSVITPPDCETTITKSFVVSNGNPFVLISSADKGTVCVPTGKSRP